MMRGKPQSPGAIGAAANRDGSRSDPEREAALGKWATRKASAWVRPDSSVRPLAQAWHKRGASVLPRRCSGVAPGL
jgi:hypothetical protein